MTIHYNINKKNRELLSWAIFRVPEVIRITCNIAAHNLPNVYVPSPQACIPRASGIHIY